MDIEQPVLSLGSCFSAEIGQRLKDDGCDILVNPFGVLYNPASIAASVKFLSDAGFRFTEGDVTERDPCYFAGRHRKKNDSAFGNTDVSGHPPHDSHRPIAPCTGGYTSFHHHGSFTRPTAEEFLRSANESLDAARAFFSGARTIVVTFGTAWVFRHLERNIIVSNCHKHRPDEFRRERLSVADITGLWRPILERSEKKWIFTVSPIRHLKDGLHGSRVSKAILLLACDELCTMFPDKSSYFPSYEIMTDELRDYRWYASDGVHPSEEAVNLICRRFIGES